MGFSKVPLGNESWVPGFLRLLRKIPASTAQGRQLPFKQTTMCVPGVGESGTGSSVGSTVRYILFLTPCWAALPAWWDA